MEKKTVMATLIGVIIVFSAMFGYVMYVKKGIPPEGDGPTKTEAPSPSLGMSEVTDTANLYLVEIPKGWQITHETISDGFNLSSFEAKSPDFKVEVTQPVDSSHSDIYIRSGASMNAHTSIGSILPPYHNPAEVIIESRAVVIDGMEGEYHKFTAPSYKEALSLDAHVNYKNNYYGFSFFYNPSAYPQGEEVFTRMLNSIRFEK